MKCKTVIPSTASKGNTRLNAKPIFIFALKASDINPTTDGPKKQPTSPEKARIPKVDDLQSNKVDEAREYTPGHKMPTNSPHTPQPIKLKIGAGEKTMIRKDATQPHAERKRNFLSVSGLTQNA